MQLPRRAAQLAVATAAFAILPEPGASALSVVDPGPGIDRETRYVAVASRSVARTRTGLLRYLTMSRLRR